MAMNNIYTKLMLVTSKGQESYRNYLEFIFTCINNGVTSVQLREPDLHDQDLFDYGIKLKSLLCHNNIPLIVNNNIELCLRLEAEGVHLGQTDESPVEARKALGPQKIIGLTANNISQVEAAMNLPIDYIGIGAVFPTKNYSTESNWDLDMIKKAVSISNHPIIAIGGINEKNAKSIVETGINGIAVIKALHESLNVKNTVRTLRNIIDSSNLYDRNN